MKTWSHLVLLAGAVLCFRAEAGWFGFGTRRIDTVVVTGNYAKARLLAEMFQRETKQPIVLISPEGPGRQELYYLPYSGPAAAFPTEKYAEFMDYLNPRRVIFLGDESYVAASYVDAVRARFPVMVVNGRDWLQNAKALGVIIRDRGLAKRYASCFDKLDEAAGSIPAGGGAPSATVPDEPAAPPQMAPAQP